MLTLMYVAVAISTLIVFLLFRLQASKLKKRKGDSNYRYKRMWGIVFVDSVIFCMLFISIAFIFPFLEWHLGAKDYQIEDEVLGETDIKPISQSNNNIYVREQYDSNNNKKYIVNVGGRLQEYDSSSTTIDENNINKNNVRITDVAEYNVYELRGRGIIVNCVNDMYANVYINNTQKIYLRKKNQICVPQNAVEKSK
ncbi:MAG: hypothetical protein Q8936_02565 [Bacillota bacterium]|nr:hypothetical protein [Bacillota bacterium]